MVDMEAAVTGFRNGLVFDAAMLERFGTTFVDKLQYTTGVSWNGIARLAANRL